MRSPSDGTYHCSKDRHIAPFHLGKLCLVNDTLEKGDRVIIVMANRHISDIREILA